MNIEVGKTYVCNHSRKGSFVLRVTDVSDGWVTGDIVSGEAHHITKEPATMGESISVRDTLASFKEVTVVPIHRTGDTEVDMS